MTPAPPKRFYEGRPLVFTAIAYASGAAAGLIVGTEYYIPAILCGLSVLLALLCKRRAVLFAGVVFFAAALTLHGMQRPAGFESSAATLTGTVQSDAAVEDGRVRTVLRDVTIDGVRYPDGVRVTLMGEILFSAGDRLTMRGKTYLPEGRRNPGGFDDASWNWARGIGLGAYGEAENASVEVLHGFSPSAVFSVSRAAIGRVIDRVFSRQPGLVRALILGERDALPDEVLEGFRDLGLSHLLSVSGLHIGCLALALDWLLRRLGVNRKWAYGLIVAGLLFYAALVGFTPSVLRAAAMYALMRLAPILGHPNDGLTGLACAFLLLAVSRPAMIVDYGFILSFSCVAALILLTPAFNRLFVRIPLGSSRKRGLPMRARRGLRNFFGMLAASLAVTVATLPVVATCFGSVSPYTVLLNLLAIPLTTMALPLVLAAIALGFASTAIGQWVAFAPDLLLDWLIWIIDRASNWPFASIALPVWPSLAIALYAAACFLASDHVRLELRFRRLALLALPVLFGCVYLYTGFLMPRGFEAVFLDAGQADAAVVYAQRRVYLVDLGDSSSPTDDYLRSLGISRVSGAFLSHAHSDHVGGLREVLDQVDIDVIYLSSHWADEPLTEELAQQLRRAIERGSRVEVVAAGDEIALSEEITATVLTPARDAEYANLNASSMVLQMRYGEGSALFLADLVRAAEQHPFPRVDVMKVAHHGSNNASSELLIRSTMPAVAVISVGRNSYGHPTEPVLNRLHRVGAEVFRTDRSGAVFVNIGKDGVATVRTFLREKQDG